MAASSASDFSSVTPNPSQPGTLVHQKRFPRWLALLVVALCLAVIGGVGYGVVYPQISAGSNWRQAKKALENRDLAKAERHLQSCANVWATDGEVHFLLARTYRRAGNFDKTRLHLQQAAKHHWVPEQIRLENLLMKAQTGRLPESIPQLQEQLKQGHQDDILIFEALIIGSLQINNFPEANRWATIWIEQHPDDWLARFWLGVVLEEAHEYDLSAREYQKALGLNPNGAEVHLRLAEVLMRPNPSDDALSHYQAALAADPDNPFALLGLARCQHSLGNNEAAKAALDQLIERDHQNFGAYSLLGQLALEADDREQALDWLQKAHDINPGHIATNKQLEFVLRKLNRDDEAKEAAQRIQQLERLATRLEEITKAVLDQPKDVTLRQEAGDILFQFGDYQKAFRWFISALLIDPNHRPTRESTKKCLRKMGDEELLERYKAILDEQPHQAASRNELR
jgi:tetratricopeptide (TPR) repeat protein